MTKFNVRRFLDEQRRRSSPAFATNKRYYHRPVDPSVIIDELIDALSEADSPFDERVYVIVEISLFRPNGATITYVTPGAIDVPSGSCRCTEIVIADEGDTVIIYIDQQRVTYRNVPYRELSIEDPDA